MGNLLFHKLIGEEVGNMRSLFLIFFFLLITFSFAFAASEDEGALSCPENDEALCALSEDGAVDEEMGALHHRRPHPVRPLPPRPPYRPPYPPYPPRPGWCEASYQRCLNDCYYYYPPGTRARIDCINNCRSAWWWCASW